MAGKKRVWIFRHGPKAAGPEKNGVYPSMPLKDPEGIEAVMKMPDLFLKGQIFWEIWTSQLVRAYQTGVILAEALSMEFPRLVEGLGGPRYIIQKWDELLSELKSYTCFDFFMADPIFVQSEGERVFDTIMWLATNATPANQQLLCVSHGGLIEPATAHARSLVNESFEYEIHRIVDLKECEGVIFIFNDKNEFLDTKELRLQ